jgi:hypothetical protein
MSLAKRSRIAPFLVFGLVACGDVVGAPITSQSNSQSGIDAGAHTPDASSPHPSCTPPANPMSCQRTQDCGNYPSTVCEQGSCVCPSTDAGAQTADASSPHPSCTPPANPLSCQQTQDCGNYPSTVCAQGFCVCASSDAGAQTPDASSPHPSCTPPANPLSCQQTQDCANYPNTVCGQTGFCVCP